MGLAGQGQEVRDNFTAERQQPGLYLIPAVRPGFVKVKPEVGIIHLSSVVNNNNSQPEHDPQTTRKALGLLFEQVWLGIANEARFPQQRSLLAVGIEVPGEPVGLDEAVEEGVEMVEGETAVHPALCPSRGVVAGLRVVVLSPGQVLRVLPEVSNVTQSVRSSICYVYRLEVAG